VSALPWRADGDDVLIAIRLTPRSAKEGIAGIWTDDKGALWLQVQVRAVPEKGQANTALIQLMAKHLNVRPKDIALESGDTARLKRIRITGMANEAAGIAGKLSIS
jgi:uncharacterized protein